MPLMIESAHQGDTFIGQDVTGSNEHGCPFIGQTVETGVQLASLATFASSLGLTVEELLAELKTASIA
jgi:hypothetical protein